MVGNGRVKLIKSRLFARFAQKLGNSRKKWFVTWNWNISTIKAVVLMDAPTKLELLSMETSSGNVSISEIGEFSTQIKYETNFTNFEHFLVQTEQSKCSCFYCGRLFRTPLLKFEHHLSLHKSYPCQFCDRTFTQAAAFKAHQYTHKDKKAFLCPKCGKGLGTEFSLKTHSATVCGDDAAIKEKIMKKQRESHLNRKKKAKPWKCPLCPKRFIEERNLDAHNDS